MTIRFHLKVKHDKGFVTIVTHATDEAAARRQVIAAERCPERAIRQVRAEDADGFELDPKTLKYRMFRPRQIRTDNLEEFYAAQARQFPAHKVPTRYEIRVEEDSRWRRVYSTRHTGARYVFINSLKVMLDLEDLTC